MAYSPLRIGIPVIGGRDWFAGVTYIQTIARAVATLPAVERPALFLVVNDRRLADLDLHQPFLDLFTGIIYLGPDRDQAKAAINAPFRHCLSHADLFREIDFLFPVNSELLPIGCNGSWIPDFQHRHLPAMFSKEEIAWRDQQFARIAARAKLVVVSSRAVEKDFRRFHPCAQARVEVLTTRVWPDDEWYESDPVAVQEKYNLPDRFLLCANQFWVHKNHSRLFEAIAHLRKEGHEVHLVCTGQTNDYRFPNYYPALERYIAQAGLGDLVHILGLIPRVDQVQLLRRCVAVVQPSLFEGLSLIVQESRVLGKPLILSDLDIHRDEGYGTLFAKTDSHDLAAKILSLWQTAPPGPDLVREAAAKAQAVELVRQFAREFLALASAARRDYAAEIAVFERQPVTIATSIAPRDLDNQRAALATWLEQGFKIISLNAVDEIAAVASHFPGVEFVPASRDARDKWGRPYIFFDDLIALLRRQPSRIVGIINADIHLFRPRFHDQVRDEALGSFVFGSRFDVPSLAETRYGRMYDGFDYFFFDRETLPAYPAEEFCLGLPWWDYWVIIIPIAQGLTVKKVVSPSVYHIAHQNNWEMEIFEPLGRRVAQYITPPFPVDGEKIRFFGWFVYQQVICSKAVDLLLD